VAVAFTRCARPEFGRVSAYTVLGFAGYVVASGLASALFVAWDLALADRIIGALVPPLAFLAVVALNRAILGQESASAHSWCSAGSAASQSHAATAAPRGSALSTAPRTCASICRRGGAAARCGRRSSSRAARAWLPPHLHEVDRACEKALARRERLETSLGLAISCHALPDGRIDWVLSSTHPAWSVDVARRLAAALWPDDEIAPGRTPGIVHVIATAEQPIDLHRWRASPD